MGLRYHQEILQLLGEEMPRFFPDAEKAIERQEATCGVRFPEAVREWFSLAGTSELFRNNTNEDHLVPFYKLGNPAEVAQGYLHVATENQAVVAWYVKLGDEEDGPVFHNNDEWGKDLSKIPWRQVATSFRTFIFDSLAGYRWRCWHTGLRLEAHTGAPDQTLLQQLRARMSEGPRTNQSDSQVHRFFTDSSLLHIQSFDDDIRSNRAKWIFEADSSEALSELVGSVWQFGDLANTLQPKWSGAEKDSPANEIIASLRKKRR